MKICRFEFALLMIAILFVVSNWTLAGPLDRRTMEPRRNPAADDMIRIPGVVGMNYREAMMYLQQAGLNPQLKRIKSFNKKHEGKEGEVIRQMPLPAGVAMIGSSVTIVYYLPKGMEEPTGNVSDYDYELGGGGSNYGYGQGEPQERYMDYPAESVEEGGGPGWRMPSERQWRPQSAPEAGVPPAIGDQSDDDWDTAPSSPLGTSEVNPDRSDIIMDDRLQVGAKGEKPVTDSDQKPLAGAKMPVSKDVGTTGHSK